MADLLDRVRAAARVDGLRCLHVPAVSVGGDDPGLPQPRRTEPLVLGRPAEPPQPPGAVVDRPLQQSGCAAFDRLLALAQGAGEVRIGDVRGAWDQPGNQVAGALAAAGGVAPSWPLAGSGS